MPNWNRTISLAEVVAGYHAGKHTIPELAERVAAIIEGSGWLEDTPYPDTLRDHLGALKNTATPAEYTAVFELIYDVADEDRVWIETS